MLTQHERSIRAMLDQSFTQILIALGHDETDLATTIAAARQLLDLAEVELRSEETHIERPAGTLSGRNELA